MDPTLYVGDSLHVLKALPNESIDSIVTDPPYELTGKSGTGGFMGKAWDATGIAYNVDLWAECLRVLKPGGHLLSFGAPRTYHRMASAIEDAGFEIRDSIHWTYGCLTDDTEVLTSGGWVNGTDVAVGDIVAQWDPNTERITLAPVQETFLAPWDGPMVVLRNSDTYQVLTPNHRVYHKTRDHRSRNSVPYHEWSEWKVAEASSFSRGSQIKVPMAGIHDGEGIGGTDYAALLGWVWTEGGFDKTGTGVRVYQTSVNQPYCDEIAALMDRIGAHKRYDRERNYADNHAQRSRIMGGRESSLTGTYMESTWYFSGELANRVRDDLPGKHPTYDLLWRMTSGEKEAFLDAALKGDGAQSKGGSWRFEQKDDDDRVWFVTLLAVTNRRGHDYKRKTRSGGIVSITQSPATGLSYKALNTHQTEKYTGNVWCIRVPTGAFVARRNGQVFITGNSGFPKSLDVSKVIDRNAGAVREIVGKYRRPDGSGERATESNGPSIYQGIGGDHEVTAPATVEAEQWAGWGTALKPSHEPIVVARKPLTGTVVENVLEHGVGAINVGGCRIVGEPVQAQAANTTGNFTTPGPDGPRPREYSNAGRWPANTILTHAEGCARVGEGKVKASVSVRRNGVKANEDNIGMGMGVFKAGAENVTLGDADGNETVSIYECVDGCPAKAMNEQSGYSKDGVAVKSRSGGKNFGSDTPKPLAPDQTYGGAGGASRFFQNVEWNPATDDLGNLLYMPKAAKKERPVVNGVTHATVKPLALMRYLVRLVTPIGGVVLDPFAGSGTTMEAAVQEGMIPIGVELTPEHVPLIEARMTRSGNTLDGFHGELTIVRET